MFSYIYNRLKLKLDRESNIINKQQILSGQVNAVRVISASVLELADRHV